MRELFSCERRCIENVVGIHKVRGQIQVGGLRVIEEYYALPRFGGKGRFNLDFTLEFAPRAEWKRHRSYCASILPNALGAELFVTIDPDTGRPLRIELLSGEAFSMRYYRAYIERIEQALTLLAIKMKLRSAAYSRVLVVGQDICFLFSPHSHTPVPGREHVVYTTEESEVTLHSDDCGVCCVEGWVHVEVQQSEWKLVAIPK